MPLTDLRVRTAKPADKHYKLSDTDGLYLLVSPAGGRLWRFAYRSAGKQKSLALGTYPAVSLSEARTALAAAKKVLQAGSDPGETRKAEARQRTLNAENTFKAVAEEWIAKQKREGRAQITIGKKEWLLGFAYPVIGNRPISEIASIEVLEALRKVEVGGRFESARRLRSTIGGVFRYAIATGRAGNDPTVALRGALTTPSVKHRPAILEPQAFGGLLRSIDGYGGQTTTRAALQLMALLFPRPGELAKAEWREFDLEKAVWNIPAQHAKKRRAYRVPLPEQAIAIILNLREVCRRSDLLLPSLTSAARPISENTMGQALKRLGYSGDEHVPHGFRSTASTLLNESGLWNPDAIERQLAHVEENNVRRAYARGEHWEERVRMMNWWAHYLDQLRVGAQIIPMRSR